MSRPTFVPAAVLLISAVLVLFSPSAAAHNITRLLGQYPDFSQFNSLLTQTELYKEINQRKSITVLAVTNDRLGGINGKPVDVLKRILSSHVVLDYYDVMKLNKLKNTKTMMTTLYQASGVADDQQGFLDVVHKTDGSIVFGSAMKGSPIDCTLEGSVASQPYNISVLSVSHIIIAPGIDGSFNPPAAAPPKAAQAPTPTGEVPAPAESPEEESADAPATESPAPAPANGPVADAPVDGPVADAPVDGPVADAPADGPAADAPGPAAEGPAADADTDQSPPPASSARKQFVSGIFVSLAVAVTAVLAGH